MGQERQLPMDRIQAEYECKGSFNDKISISELAEKYGTTSGYLYKISSKQGWQKGRYKDNVKKEVEDELIEHSKEKHKELRNIYNTALNYVFEQVENALHKDGTDLSEARYYNKMVNTLQKLREEHWEVNNIQEVNALIRQEFKSLNAENNSLELSFEDFEEYMEKEDSDQLLDMAEKEAEVLKNKQQDN
ncbi:MAG: hypothetical protein ABEI78_00550 [Candidatus Nanohaloarchaea archaeon]